MHRRRLAAKSFLVCLLTALAGCADRPQLPPIARCVFVEESVGAAPAGLTRAADVIHDASVRTLLSRGYLAALEPAQAEAFLRAAWISRPSAAGTLDGRVTLRMTLVKRDGTMLRAFDVLADAPVFSLTDDRLAELVRTQLGAGLP